MDVREGATTDRVAELRRALYRPDPPAGAVAAYLAAAGSVAPPPVAVEIAARRRRGPGPVVVAVTVVAALLLLGIALRGAPAAPEVREPITAADPFPPATGAEIGAMSGGPATTRAFDAGGRTVVVSVLCDEVGTLTLRIGDDPTTVLTCQAGPPALALIPSAGALRSFPVTITPSGPVRWTATIGALPAAP